jgi:hypothetical protein
MPRRVKVAKNKKFLYTKRVFTRIFAMKQNIIKVITDPISLLWGSWVVFGMSLLQYRQFDFQFVVGNLWIAFARAEVILYTLITLLFALFVMAQTYKIRYVGRGKKKKSTSGFLGGIIGIITVGCPACSITIASFIGLSWLIALLPFDWLELKVLAVCLLFWANYMILKDLLVCKK